MSIAAWPTTLTLELVEQTPGNIKLLNEATKAAKSHEPIEINGCKYLVARIYTNYNSTTVFIELSEAN